MLLTGMFGIDNEGLDTAVKLLILVLVVVWLALVYYTYADARRRIADPMLVGCATAASLFPFVGTVVYMIVRPPEYLEDVRERELEMQAAEARLHSLNYILCPHCDNEVEKDFLRCPNCMRKLKDPCTSCGRPLDPARDEAVQKQKRHEGGEDRHQPTSMRNAARNLPPGGTSRRPRPLASAFVGAVIGSSATKSAFLGAYTCAYR